ncbi:MAG: hypothetical protein QM811_03445 [Pirellulales bacterium]
MVADLDIDAMISNRQRLVPAIGQIHDQRPERFAGRGPFEPSEPLRRLFDLDELLLFIDAHEDPARLGELAVALAAASRVNSVSF